jgi:magnesium transporter
MTKLLKTRSAKTGLPPGSLVYLGEKSDKETHISLVGYTAAELHSTTPQSFRECAAVMPGAGVTWINVNGLQKVTHLEEMGSCFNFHPLVLEDILNTDQRPKLEDYGDYLFIVLKMLHLRGVQREIVTEQVSLILGENYLVSLHELDEEVFEPIVERLQANRGRLRQEGADYLAYTLLDLIVDHYFLILEELGEVIEELEAELVARPNPVTLNRIHRLKRDTIMLRKAVWPLREVISRLERSDSPLIKAPTALYLRDVYDHVIQVIDNIETFRDILSGMLDIYLSSVSNRLNEIMKVLTIIATIFIPLTFITGIYGMNFERLWPDKEWPWGFHATMGFMAVMAGGMLLFFRRKGWLGGRSEPPKP